MHKRDLAQVVEGGFFAEEIRRNIIEKYGEEKLYQGGLTIHTTVDPDLQKLAQKCLQDGLEAYDRRHGWRGPFARTKQTTGSWHKDLKKFPQPEGMGNWKISIVTDSNSSKASIGFHSGKVGVIPRAQAKWTRRAGHMSSLLRPGDIIFVQHVENKPGVFALKQVPKASGGLIAIDPYTSRVLALQGGFSYGISQFNRATQALRQPGSAFKPFVFLAALERGMSPSSIVRDSPFSISLGWGRGMWRPRNYNHKYMGSITIRKAVEKSRNVPTVRITHEKLGMNKIIEMAKKFGISDKMPKHLSAVLGSSETTLIKMTAAYASLVNGGRKVNPILVDRIQDRHGHTIEFGAPRKCVGCVTGIWNNQERPTITDISSKATDPRSAYQMVNILTGVVKQGTAQVIKRIAGTEHPLGGKTGTTNDYKDAWFIGISPRLVVGTYIGFDNPKSLGRGEAGSRAAAPIVGNFFKEALKNQPPIPYNIPAGIRMVKVNKNSGRRTYASGNSVIMEAFKYDDYYDDGDDLGYDFDDSPASFTTSTQRRPRTYTSKITKTKSRSRKKRSSGGNGNSGLGGLY